MKLIYKILIINFFLFQIGATVFAQNTVNPIEDVKSEVEFSAEDIEKIKTLIEHQLHTKISHSEFNMFGKPSKANLSLFEKINENQKENPFFSQDHVSFIIDSMKFKLGMDRPKPKSERRKAEKFITKLPKSNSDLN